MGSLCQKDVHFDMEKHCEDLKPADPTKIQDPLVRYEKKFPFHRTHVTYIR